MAAKTLPDQAYLRECFDYDAETGALLWRCRPSHHFVSDGAALAWNAKCSGKEAGSRKASGYVLITLNRTKWRAHRVIWKLQTGEDPSISDHRNGIRHDNRWANLRLATAAQNARNQRRKKLRDLPKGVERSRSGTFIARLRMDGRNVHLGTFHTPGDAHRRYCEAAAGAFGDFWSPD